MQFKYVTRHIIVGYRKICINLQMNGGKIVLTQSVGIAYYSYFLTFPINSFLIEHRFVQKHRILFERINYRLAGYHLKNLTNLLNY